MQNNVANPFIRPTILSLCPGINGLERGIKRAIGSFHIAAYVEIEAFIIANLLAGMEEGILDTAPVWTDVKTFNAKPFRGLINGIIGGYPCQPFSTAGSRKGTDDPRHLWPYIRRHIRDIQPDWCFFENVRGHLSLGYREVRRQLEKMGYAVREGIYTAEEVGAPQRRERLFILALANSHAERLQEWRTQGTETLFRPEFGISELDNAKSEGLQNKWIRQIGAKQKHTEFTGADNELANTDSLERGIQQRKRATGSEIGRGSEELANANNERGQFPLTGKQSTNELTRWPMPQGISQHEWEEPRTIEPSLGCTVNGYNYRTDFLRALGNSVVEQTAELAFTDLLRKHIYE